ncbi:hypothetical protein [Pedobacter montanisoli]|uniref:Uncharacterized protein n=1 Tax=Pedobacter montanisoli TaxID=2923277 RepID=A0ABS9ZXH3_9SPHI|nr:hypothetical protein [Pedobacter montanisoli]MCJ0743011.1 hypothetical protein [Pedobacter montanisoli]
MKKSYILLLILVFTTLWSKAADINNFLLKESLLKNSKLSVIAADSLGHANEDVSGSYMFSVSGFSQQLTFNNGIATIPLQIDKSTFVYIKHQNQVRTISKLFYVYKSGDDLKIIQISKIFFVIIPVLIIILTFAFRKFIYLAVIILLLMTYFGYSNGLNISTYFETIFDYLKNLV